VPVKIAGCGELKGDEKLTADKAEFLETYSKPWNQGTIEEED